MHGKDQPSKGDLEVQRRVAEKQQKQAAGAGGAGVVLGGAPARVVLRTTASATTAGHQQQHSINGQAPASHEFEDWIWDTGAALGVANKDLDGDKELSFVPPILRAGGVVQPSETVVVTMPEIGDTVRAEVLANMPIALCAGPRCALQGYCFYWRPWQHNPEILAPDGTEIPCYTEEHFVLIVRRACPRRAMPAADAGPAAVPGDTAAGAGEPACGEEVPHVLLEDREADAHDISAIEHVGEDADEPTRALLKDIDRIVDDGDDGVHAEASDRIAKDTTFTMKRDDVKYEDELLCIPFAGPQSTEHQAMHLPRLRGCYGCDHGKSLHKYKRRSTQPSLGLRGPDLAVNPFGALVHIDWVEMKYGSPAHKVAPRKLMSTDQETEFLGSSPSKRKETAAVLRAIRTCDDPVAAIRRLLSDRAQELLNASREVRAQLRSHTLS